MKVFKRILIAVLIIAIIVIILVNIVKSKVGAMRDAESGYENWMFDTYTVSKDDVQSYVKGIGQITSFNIETLEFSANEKISEILVSEGTKVEKNQEIMKVTDGNKTRTIKSSISGLFFCVETEDTTKYCIYNLDDVGIKLSLPEKDISSIANGQTVMVKISALDKEFNGTVTYISSLPQNERYTVRVKIDYTDELKFGYSAIASILTMDKKDVISIPYDYLYMTENGRYYVFKENVKKEYSEILMNGGSDESLRTYIEVGSITSNLVEVNSGLAEGEKIIAQTY